MNSIRVSFIALCLAMAACALTPVKSLAPPISSEISSDNSAASGSLGDRQPAQADLSLSDTLDTEPRANSSPLLQPNQVVNKNTVAPIPKNPKDLLSGTWSSGIEIHINQIIAGNYLPSRLNIIDLELKMKDGATFNVLALKAEEHKLDKDKQYNLISQRAQHICSMTETHKFLHSFKARRKVLPDTLIDLSPPKAVDKSNSMQTYHIETLSNARYFFQVICSAVQDKPIDR
jgi:hypothetical protein